MKKLDNVDKVMLSGTTAFVTLNEEGELSRATVRKSFKAAGLKAEGVKKRSITRPKEAYQLAITGGT